MKFGAWFYGQVNDVSYILISICFLDKVCDIQVKLLRKNLGDYVCLGLVDDKVLRNLLSGKEAQ